jgi:hypothetical protein
MVKNYANIEDTLVIKEVERVLKKLREMRFEPPKEEQEDQMISDETLEKQVFSLNESFINFFKGAFY